MTFAWFSSPSDAATGSPPPATSPTPPTATTVFLAGALGKPLLVEGPAGVGKTELAKAVARATGAELVRLQCYEGLDEARALYEWNYKKQLLRIQASPADDRSWDETHDDIFTEEFLLTRPLLTAIRRDEPTVLLDRRDRQGRRRGRGPAAGGALGLPGDHPRARARSPPYAGPFVVLTSNATRELSEALKRRCLFLHLDYPDAEREREIVISRVPDLEDRSPGSWSRRWRRLRELELKKAPSIAETVDWARTLLALGIGDLDEEAVARHARRRPQARLRPGARGARAEAAASEPR